MKTWFTSDPHFGHKNIIDYCKRPFTSSDGQPDVHHMNRTMTERWNEVVGPRDVVYHLGDFCMDKNVAVIRKYREKLNGQIVLVRGNHDRGPQGMVQAGFSEVHDRLEIDLDGYHLYLAHIPVLVHDPRSPRKYNQELTKPPPKYFDYFLCGHVHERWRRKGKVINVGVDQWNFYPVSLETLLTAEDGT